MPNLANLEALQRENGDIITISLCDAEYVEVSLQGTWLVSDPNSEEGIFFTAMSDRAEFFLYKLWQEAQTLASLVSE